MPTYDYRCTDCEQEFDVFCKMAEMSDPHPCPACTSPHSQRIMKTAPMVSMNGNNFSAAKRDKGFKEVLNNIHTRSAGSILNKTTEI